MALGVGSGPGQVEAGRRVQVWDGPAPCVQAEIGPDQRPAWV